MSLEEQLKQEILSKYKSVRAFTNAIDIPYTTLDSVFKRGIANAGISTMIKVFMALDLDIESVAEPVLRKRTGANAASLLLDEAEEKLIDMYRSLNTEGKEKLLDTADDMVQSKKYKEVGSFRVDTKEA